MHSAQTLSPVQVPQIMTFTWILLHMQVESWDPKATRMIDSASSTRNIVSSLSLQDVLLE